MEMVECPADSIETDIQSFDIMTESAIPVGVKNVNPCNLLSALYKLQIPPGIKLPSNDEQTVLSN